MRAKVVFVWLVCSLLGWLLECANAELLNEENIIQPRGKKKKIALLVYLADLVLKKVLFVKIIYAILFAIVVHKAGYFIGWFVHYLKEKKHQEPEYRPHPLLEEHHTHHQYGPPHDYSSYGPYRRHVQGS